MTEDAQQNEDAGQVAVAEEGAGNLDLKVEISDVGPCKKHISVTISEKDIRQLREDTIDDLSRDTPVPGFRAGKVPKELLAKRFRQEISDQLKQKLLLQSLEQVSEEHDLDPINEPELDVENLEVPEEGDFDYEFEVEVRPEFEIPEYSGIKIRRETKEITDEDVAQARERYLGQFAQIVPVERAAQEGDYVVCNVEVTHDGNVLRKFDELTVRVRPTLRFQDAELEGFSELVSGAKADDVCEAEIKISREAANVEMRDESVQAKFTILDVKEVELPELDEEMLERIGAKDEEQLNEYLKDSLVRQVSYEQRQQTREQVLEKITESASWELPEGLVKKHTENALRREMLEMQQAGFSRQQIMARENELRQKSTSTTQQALKEHFVLDRIASQEDIECTNQDISTEIQYMAYQQGENPRKLRSRLAKNGMLENLEAQIRERKAVDFILENATFEDVPMEDFGQDNVESVSKSITSSIQDTDAEAEEEGGEE